MIKEHTAQPQSSRYNHDAIQSYHHRRVLAYVCVRSSPYGTYG